MSNMDHPSTSEWSLTIASKNNTVLVDGFILANFTRNEDLQSPLISDKAMQKINIYVNILICGSLAAFGTVNNVINMIIFYKLGLKDSMSVGLLFLSLTDFLHSFLIVLSRGFSIWETFFHPLSVDPLAINYICFDWIRDIFYLCSGWTTTFLSIERCVCVVFPFKVKQIFTRLRCIVIVIIVYVIHVCIYMPAFVTQWLGWKEIEVITGNSTVLSQRLVALFSEARPQVDAYIDIADGFPIISQIIVMISVVCMIHGLRMSSRLRTTVVANFNNDDFERRSGMSSKNKRLVKAVLFLAIILIICNIPRIVAAYARHIHSGIMFGRMDRNLFVFLWTIAILFTVINTSVNIFVYLLINSSYRARFKEMFGCQNLSDRDK